MPYVEASIVIRADPDEVYAVVKDMEQYPLFMRDVEKVKIIERKDRCTVTEWVANVEGTPIYWTEEDRFDDENRTVLYHLIEGDLDKFEGSWRLIPTQEGTLVILGVDYDFGIPSLSDLIGPTLDIKVRENSEMMLQGIKEKVEGRK